MASVQGVDPQTVIEREELAFKLMFYNNVNPRDAMITSGCNYPVGGKKYRFFSCLAIDLFISLFVAELMSRFNCCTLSLFALGNLTFVSSNFVFFAFVASFACLRLR